MNLHWGLVPFWAKDKPIGNRTINARLESVAEKPAVRKAFKKRRCLIPGNGLYGWTGKAGNKQPYYHPSGGGAVCRDRGCMEWVIYFFSFRISIFYRL